MISYTVVIFSYFFKNPLAFPYILLVFFETEPANGLAAAGGRFSGHGLWDVAGLAGRHPVGDKPPSHCLIG